LPFETRLLPCAASGAENPLSHFNMNPTALIDKVVNRAVLGAAELTGRAA